MLFSSLLIHNFFSHSLKIPVPGQRHATVLHVVDATNFESTLIRTVRNLVGKAPLYLIVTKCDLLPEYGVINEDSQAAQTLQELHRKSRGRRKRRKRGGRFSEDEFEMGMSHLSEYDSPSQRYLKWYFRERLHRRGIRCQGVFLTSGLLETGLDDLAVQILETVNGNNVYVCGMSNVGKSTLTNALAQKLFSAQYFKDKKDVKRKLNTLDETATVSALP